MPMRIFNNRSRSGAYLVMLVIGAAMFGMFYFLTFFVQGVMGFSSLKAGVAFLPVSAVIIVGSGIVAQVLPKIGPKPLISVGSGLVAAGLFLFSASVSAHSSYVGTILPGMLVLALGMAFIFVPLTGVAVAKVRVTDSGLASALLNVGQQVGGSIGLAVLATVAAKSGKSAFKTQSANLASSGHESSIPHFQQLSGSVTSGARPPDAALADGPALHAFKVMQAHSDSMGFLVAAIMGCVAFVTAVLLINVRKEDVPSEGVAVAA